MNLIFRVMTLVMAMLVCAAQQGSTQGTIESLPDGQYNYCSIPKPDWAAQVLPIAAAEVQPMAELTTPGEPPAIPIAVLPAEAAVVSGNEPAPPLTKSSSSLDISLLHYLSQTNAVCFEFHKQNDQIRGILNSPSAYGTDGIHLEGLGSTSTVIGRAVQVFVDGPDQVRRDPMVPVQNVQEYWNTKGFVQLSQPKFYDSAVPMVIYGNVTLNLANFYAY